MSPTVIASNLEAPRALPPPRPPEVLPETPSPHDWQVEWLAALPELEQPRRRVPNNVNIMRSSQLDAARLDVELTTLLREQFQAVFSLFNQRLIAALQPEMNLLLDFLIFRFSIWVDRPTPGQALMNLRYRDERALIPPRGKQDAGPGPSSSLPSTGPWVAGNSGVAGPRLDRYQRAMYGIAMVFGRYMWSRLDAVAAARHWGDLPEGTWGARAWQSLRWGENVFQLGSLLNFIVFMRFGTYRSLVERILRARLVYAKPLMQHAQSFEYLNRQLVWTELSQFMLFLLPLVDTTKLRRFVFSRLPRVSSPASDFHGAGSGTGLAASLESEVQEPCAICGTSQVVVPYEALPCHHRFCYYCLRTQTQGDPTFACPRCSVRVTAMRRWRPRRASAA